MKDRPDWVMTGVPTMLPLFVRLSLSILVLSLGGCGLFPKTVKVASKNTTTQMVLAEIAAQHLEAKSFKIVRRIGMGNTALVHQATLSRDVDIYPEDTGAAIAGMLKENPIPDPESQWERVRNEYERLFGLRFSRPLGAVNGPIAVIPEELGAKEKITTLSEAVDSRVSWRLGVTEEFTARLDGSSAFSSRYRLQQKEATRSQESSSPLYQALQDHQLDMVIGNESDGQLSGPGLRILTDDRKVFAPGQLCLLARRDTLDAAPGLEAALNQLSGKISTADLRAMGKQVEVDKRPVADVAREFLKKAGL